MKIKIDLINLYRIRNIDMKNEKNNENENKHNDNDMKMRIMIFDLKYY